MSFLAVSPDASYSYDGDTLDYVDAETIMQVCGNGLRFFSSRSGQQSFMWAKGSTGISAATSHSKTKRFAYAMRTSNPEIYVHIFPENTLQATLKGGTDLEYSALTFSRDGRLLAGIGKLTDYKFAVWDIASESLLKGGEISLPVPCNFVSFNPLNPFQLCTGGEKGIFFWSLNRSYDTFYLVPTKGVIKVDNELDDGSLDEVEEEEEEEDGPRNQFTSHCWSPDGGVYASNMAGELIRFSFETGQVLECIQVGGGVIINALLLMKEHLVCHSII